MPFAFLKVVHHRSMTGPWIRGKVGPPGGWWVFRCGASSSEVALVSVFSGGGGFGGNSWVLVIVAGGNLTGRSGDLEVSGSAPGWMSDSMAEDGSFVAGTVVATPTRGSWSDGDDSSLSRCWFIDSWLVIIDSGVRFVAPSMSWVVSRGGVWLHLFVGNYRWTGGVDFALHRFCVLMDLGVISLVFCLPWVVLV